MAGTKHNPPFGVGGADYRDLPGVPADSEVVVGTGHEQGGTGKTGGVSGQGRGKTGGEEEVDLVALVHTGSYPLFLKPHCPPFLSLDIHHQTW